MFAPPWRMMNFRVGQLLLVALCFVVFIYLVLALAEVGGVAGCHWAFPRWFGCALYIHEALAGGLIVAAGALVAAWIAWTAVQQQINAEQQRSMQKVSFQESACGSLNGFGIFGNPGFLREKKKAAQEQRSHTQEHRDNQNGDPKGKLSKGRIIWADLVPDPAKLIQMVGQEQAMGKNYQKSHCQRQEQPATQKAVSQGWSQQAGEKECPGEQ